MSDVFEVKPVIKSVLNPQTGLYHLTIDTGAEDNHRRLLSKDGFCDNLDIDIQVTKDDAGDNIYVANIKLSSTTTAGTSAVIEHRAQYTIGEQIAQEFTVNDIQSEIKSGWFNAISAALLNHGTPEDSTPVVQAAGLPSPAQVMGLRGANSSLTATGVKQLPTSWIVIGSSIVTFLVTLLVIFLLQGILSSANAKGGSKPASAHTAPSTTFASTTTATDSDLPMINGEALAHAQHQTVTDLLKDMGINPAHNQQDLSCLAQ